MKNRALVALFCFVFGMHSASAMDNANNRKTVQIEKIKKSSSKANNQPLAVWHENSAIDLLKKQPRELIDYTVSFINPLHALDDKLECSAINHSDMELCPATCALAKDTNALIVAIRSGTHKQTQSSGSQIKSYDLAKKTLDTLFSIDEEDIKHIAVSSQGYGFLTATGSSSSAIMLPGGSRGYTKFNNLSDLGIKGRFTSLALSADGAIACVGCSGGQLFILKKVNKAWDVSPVINAHSKRISAIAISPDNSYLVTASDDADAAMWTINGECLGVLEGHAEAIQTVAISADGRIIATGSNDKSVIIWHAKTGKQKVELPMNFAVNSVALSADGSFVAIGFDNEYVSLWDSNNRKNITSFATNDHHKKVASVEFTCDMNTLIIGLKEDCFGCIAHACSIGAYNQMKKALATVSHLALRSTDKKRYPELRCYFMNKLEDARAQGKKLTLDASLITDKDGSKHRGFLYEIYENCFNLQEQSALEGIAIDTKKKKSTIMRFIDVVKRNK